jgi:hypothetical protein
MWEETGSQPYHDIAVNFCHIVTGHHMYIIGGSGNHEHWHAPDVIAGQLSNFTCEGCVTYNVLAGACGTDTSTAMPLLDTASVRRAGPQPMTFTAVADGKSVTLIPVARAHHQHYTVYWRRADLPPAPASVPGRRPAPGTRSPSRAPKEDRL